MALAVQTSAVDALVEISGDLKGQLIEFSMKPRFSRQLREAIKRRFGGDTIVGDEEEVGNFFDWFVLQYWLHDGSTIVDRFVDSRTGLSPVQREFLRGWREVRECVFEVVGRDGDVLVAEDLLDDLPYRVHSNQGGAVFDQTPEGCFLLARVVPVLDEWLLSGLGSGYLADQRDTVLTAAAQVVAANPQLALRNPKHLARAWDIQAEHRATFLRHFGTDELVVLCEDVPATMGGFWEALQGDRRMPTDEWPVGYATVGVIYDEKLGLGLFPEYGIAEQAFADPGLAARSREHREVVRSYITEPSTDPTPILRLCERYPDNAATVVRAALGRPGLAWDGPEPMLRTFKKPWYERPFVPRISVISDRLAPYLSGRAPSGGRGSGQTRAVARPPRR
jgi:hypothetical protein